MFTLNFNLELHQIASILLIANFAIAISSLAWIGCTLWARILIDLKEQQCDGQG